MQASEVVNGSWVGNETARDRGESFSVAVFKVSIIAEYNLLLVGTDIYFYFVDTAWVIVRWYAPKAYK
jgi:hypothetical protein